jgi:hypothetical protein
MYNTTFSCTYKNIVDEELSNTKYQEEVLKAFNMSNFSEDLTTNIEKLYKTISYDFTEILTHVKFIYANDNDMLFMILFSYDFFKYTHELIKKIIEKEDTTTECKKLIDMLKTIYE